MRKASHWCFAFLSSAPTSTPVISVLHLKMFASGFFCCCLVFLKKMKGENKRSSVFLTTYSFIATFSSLRKSVSPWVEHF